MPSDHAESIRLRHAPYRDWIIDGLLTLVFLTISVGLFILLLRIASDPDKLDLTLLIFSGSVAAFVVSFLTGKSVLSSAISSVTVDPENQSVDITRYRIYGKRTERYLFHQIEKFRSYRSKRLWYSRYFLELILINKKKIRIRVISGTDQGDTTKFIKSLNKILKGRKVGTSRATPSLIETKPISKMKVEH